MVARRANCRCDRIPFYDAATITGKIRAIAAAYDRAALPEGLGTYLAAETLEAFVDLASRITTKAIVTSLDAQVSDPGSPGFGTV